MMPLFLAPTEMAQTLHETNARLRFWFDSLNLDRELSGRELSAQELRAATPEQMAGLLSELMRAGEALRGLHSDLDASIDVELGEYRRLVERLRALMPTIHGVLLRERARVEQQRSQVQAASEWAERSRQTL